MSPRVRKAVRAIQSEMEKNAPKVERMVARSGRWPDPTVLLTLKIYYETLKKLAKE